MSFATITAAVLFLALLSLLGGRYRYAGAPVRLAVTYLFVTAGSLVAVLFLYSVAMEQWIGGETPRFSEGVTIAVTVGLITCWVVWVATLGYRLRRAMDVPARVTLVIAAVVLVPSTLALMTFVSFINACNNDMSFPFGGSSC